MEDALDVGGLPTVYVPRLLRFVAAQTEESPHIEFCLLWIRALVDKHGAWLSANRGGMDVELRVVARAISRMRDEIRRLADENVYMVDYLLTQAETGNGLEEEKGKVTNGEAKGQEEKLLNGSEAADADEDASSDDGEGWVGLD